MSPPWPQRVRTLGNAGGATLVAIDLGAESCRVSLLQWQRDRPRFTIVRRFANAPWDQGRVGLRWNLDHICRELEAGLHSCADRASEGIAGIGVTGWGVDYVRLNSSGRPIEPPFCYRDPRADAAFKAMHAFIPAERLYAKTGVQVQAINTIYQLYADKLSGSPPASWVMLPEYILHWLGAPRVAEYTNATHTALIDPDTRSWSDEIYTAVGLDRSTAPELVPTGAALGPLRQDLRKLPAFASTQLFAPACHDTASAIAGIPPHAGDWAYISSGTWSLVGMVLSESHRAPEAFASNFTNLGAAGGGALFHRGFAGMWLLRQCLNTWENEREWKLEDLIGAARRLPVPDAVLDLEDPAFVSPGDMPARINTQRTQCGLAPFPHGSSAAPLYANLLFHSLASHYRTLIDKIVELTGRRPRRICVVGGGGRNEYLNTLTRDATGLPVERCSVESSTLGNFAVQWARLDQSTGEIFAAHIAARAHDLAQVAVEP
ncbi:MAG: FGGY-family carbohydrate kinase [Silvibacterium sp.]